MQYLKWSGEYIFVESLRMAMWRKCIKMCPCRQGPETFAALMRVIHSDSYEALSVGEYQRTHTGEHQVEVVSW
jgi:hypothetical protein